VLLLEAGGTNRRPEVVFPVGLPLAYKKLNWNYPVEPDASRLGAVEKWPAGRVLGGGGSINAGVFMRGNRADFDGWAAEGNVGWEYESVLPAFRRLETWEGGADSFRGGDGPIGVRWHRADHVANGAFIAAAEEAEYPFNPDYNAAGQDGVGRCQVNQRGHFRSESAREYLNRPAARRQLTVRRHAVVDRILFEGDQAVGVEYVQRGSRRTARAEKEVVLSAGAIGTPKLLLLSGVGPRDHLGEHGIPIVADSPGVGSGLHEHPTVFLHFEALVPNLNTMGPVEAARGLATYVRSSGGFLASTMAHAQALFRTDPELKVPNVIFNFANFGTKRTLAPDGEVKVGIPREGSFLITLMYTQPRPRGRVSLRSSTPTDPPRIEFEFLADDGDMKGIVTGIHEARRVMSQPAFAGIAGGLTGSEAKNRTDADWERWLREKSHGGAHQVGTARMGTDPEAVVDPELRVHSVGRLRVADASIMPRITNSATNAPTMMIAERAAELILGGGGS
jgi:choline dehydrogenase